MNISIIVAVAENGIIGRNGQMPWRLSSDLKSFRRITIGKPVIMGRKTFQSIGKPLDGRANIVITRDTTFAPDGVTTANSIEVAIATARTLAQASGAAEIMIIGGAEIYRAALPYTNRIYLTRVHAQPQGDTSFIAPSGGGWNEVSSLILPKGERDDFACRLIVLERSKQVMAS